MISDRYRASARVEGDPELNCMPSGLASLLYGVLGDVTVTGTSDPYTHTIEPATALPWWTTWSAEGGLYRHKNTDVKVGRLVLRGETGRPLRVIPGWRGIKPMYGPAAPTGTTPEVTNRYLYYDGLGALKFEGTALATIDQFELTIDNNVQVIGGDAFFPVDVAEGGLTIGLTIRRLALDAALYNRVHFNNASPSVGDAVSAVVQELGGSPAGVELAFTRVAAAPGPERSIKIALPRLAVEPYAVDSSPSANEVLREQLVLNAQEPAGATKPITVTMKVGFAAAGY
jgi:hypothetical protein